MNPNSNNEIGRPALTVLNNAQGCTKLSILSPGGTSGERTEERGNQPKCASSPQPSPPSDGGEGENGAVHAALANDAVPYIRLFTPAQHHSREAWVAEMKILIDEGKNFKLALTVTAAKGDLDYGEWTAIWMSEDRPFAKGKADKLFLIGRNLGTLDAPDRECLPLSLSALYAVARLDRETLLAHIHAGLIHRKMKVEAAEALLPKTKRKLESNPLPVKLTRWLARMHRLFDIMELDGTTPIQQAVIPPAQARLDRLAAKAAARISAAA